MAVAPEGDLTDLLLGDAGVALLVELDLDLVPVVEIVGQASDLLLGHRPQPLRHLHVPPADREVHAASDSMHPRVGRAQLTWSLPPHSPAGRLASTPVAATVARHRLM